MLRRKTARVLAWVRSQVVGFGRVDGSTRGDRTLRRRAGGGVIPHGHCPQGCDKPQPVLMWRDGKDIEICGECWHKRAVISEMVPCSTDRITGNRP